MKSKLLLPLCIVVNERWAFYAGKRSAQPPCSFTNLGEESLAFLSSEGGVFQIRLQK